MPPHIYISAFATMLWVLDGAYFFVLVMEAWVEPCWKLVKQWLAPKPSQKSSQKPSPLPPETPQTPAPPPLTLENCPRYLVIDPVFRDRVHVEAVKPLFHLPVRWGKHRRYLPVGRRRKPEDAALLAAQSMKWLPTSHGWDTRVEYSARLVVRYEERWAVVDVITHSYRTTLTGGSSTEPTHEETLTLWVRVDEPVEQVAEAI